MRVKLHVIATYRRKNRQFTLAPPGPWYRVSCLIFLSFKLQLQSRNDIVAPINVRSCMVVFIRHHIRVDHFWTLFSHFFFVFFWHQWELLQTLASACFSDFRRRQCQPSIRRNSYGARVTLKTHKIVWRLQKSQTMPIFHKQFMYYSMQFRWPMVFPGFMSFWFLFTLKFDVSKMVSFEG